jgi:hypothetical protein
VNSGYHESLLDDSCALQHDGLVSSILLQGNRFSPLLAGIFLPVRFLGANPQAVVAPVELCSSTFSRISFRLRSQQIPNISFRVSNLIRYLSIKPLVL